MNALNQLLISVGGSQVDINNIVFAFDKDVIYENDYLVSESNLIQAAQFEKVIAPHFRGGPSWIHANLIRLEDQRFLVTITTGEYVGNSCPSINVSLELSKAVKVLKRNPH